MTNQIAPLVAGGKIAGIVPTSIEEVYRLAQYVCKSGLAPYGMDTPEKVTVAILQGLEIGLPPMLAINKIAVIKGRPSIWGDAIPALLLSRGFKISERVEGAGDKRKAICEITRPDGTKNTGTFSVDDAVRAGLWQTEPRVIKRGKEGKQYESDNDSPWYRYPERMLKMRARGFAARDGAADVLGGLYLSEEAEDIPSEPKDITPKPPREKIEAVAPGEKKALPPVVGGVAATASVDSGGQEAGGEPAELDVQSTLGGDVGGRSAAGGDLASRVTVGHSGPTGGQDTAQEEDMIEDAKGYATMAAGLIKRAAKGEKQSVYDDIVRGVEHRLPGNIVASLKSLVK